MAVMPAQGNPDPHDLEGSVPVRIGDAVLTLTNLVWMREQQPPGEDGASVATTEHILLVDDQTWFTTEDEARMIPSDTPGVFELVSTLRTVEGHGSFRATSDNPSPPLKAQGTVDMREVPLAQSTLSDLICGFAG